MQQNNIFDKVIQVLEKICNAVSAVLLAITVASSAIQVFCRTVLGSPLSWTEELARFGGVWMVMWAMGPVFKARGHIGIDFLYNKFPHVSKKYVDLFDDLVTIGVMIAFTYFACILMNNGARTASPALRIPMSWVYSGVVLGGGCSVLFAVHALLYHRREHSEEEKA